MQEATVVSATQAVRLLHNQSMSQPSDAERPSLAYFIVDVFTETALAGNPLAVVMDTVGLPTECMQAIAREFNLSETSFIQRRAASVERAEGVRVRIFTTEEELQFAGHPTLGTATVLRLHAPETIQEGTVTLALNVGPVPVRLAADRLFGEMTQADPEFGEELDPAVVARLTGLRSEDLYPALPPQVVSTGTAFAIVGLRSASALERLRVMQQEASPWLRAHGARWFYVLGSTGQREPAWRARMQFYGGEDPATGSAAGCAISYLVARGAVASQQQILLEQGVEIGRTSHLYLCATRKGARVTDVRVGGSTVPVANGRIFLP